MTDVYKRCIGTEGNFSIWKTGDDEFPYAVCDSGNNLIEEFETKNEAINEARRLDRSAQIESLREALQEALDECDDADDQKILDKLTAALAAMKPED